MLLFLLTASCSQQVIGQVIFFYESFGARHGDLKGQKAGITAIDWRADGILLATASEMGRFIFGS